MGAFEFDKCCFCVDLKTGCFIIAYLSLIGYIGMAVLGIIALTVGGAIVSDNESDKDDRNAGIMVMVVGGLFLLVTVLLLTFIVVLLVGLHKNKPGHVKAYLIYAGIFIGVSTILFITGAASGKHNASSIFQNIISILLSIYFLLVIRSQYLVMKRPERGPAIYNSA